MTVNELSCRMLEYTLSGPSVCPSRYLIGDAGPSGAGIVFYVTDDGYHGLEAAMPAVNGGMDYPSSLWSNCLELVCYTGDRIGSGHLNSEAIVSQAGHRASAAQLCRNYRGGMKNDWFLPSLDELKEMRLNKILTGRKSDVFWSSTAYPADPYLACYMVLGAGSSGYATDFAFKHTEVFVRPVRAF